MKIQKVQLAITTILAVAMNASATLIVNGGFETGDLTSWISSIDTPTVTAIATDVHSGTYAAQLTGNSAIEQTVAIVAGNSYIVDFWAKRRES